MADSQRGTGKDNYDEVVKGAGRGGSTPSTPNRGDEDVHSPVTSPTYGSSPSMAGGAGSDLNPGFEGDMAGDSGVLSPRIMEGNVEYEFPGSDQGNLEHTGAEVRGAKGSQPKY
jgi:hypothetical protein